MSYIEVSHISKCYFRKNFLYDSTFSADFGDCSGLVGAIGCGKSTLLKVLCGAHRPDSGDILYDGSSPLSRKSIIRKLVGYVPQENPLFDNLTVLDNLKLWYCDSTHNLKNDIKSGIIADFGIDKYLHATVRTLSGVIKKRLSIACSIAGDPSILILDEPGASLDIVCKEDIKNYMLKYISDGGIIIIASHEEGELSVCSRMFLMNDGVLSDIAPGTSLSSLIGRLK